MATTPRTRVATMTGRTSESGRLRRVPPDAPLSVLYCLCHTTCCTACATLEVELQERATCYEAHRTFPCTALQPDNKGDQRYHRQISGRLAHPENPSSLGVARVNTSGSSPRGAP